MRLTLTFNLLLLNFALVFSETFKETFDHHLRIAEAEIASIKPRESARYHAAKNTPASRQIGVYSKTIDRVAKELGLSATEVIQKYRLEEDRVIDFPCPLDTNGVSVGVVGEDAVDFDITCDDRENEGFRRFTGRCNNLGDHPHWGARFQPFKRLVPNTYDDGYSVPTVLPNARLISKTVHPDKIAFDVRITNMLMQIGQFLDHDFSLAPENELPCCGTELSNPECFNIAIPGDDPFYSELSDPQSCLPFTRSTPLCTDRPFREQFNLITSIVDLNTIYGSDDVTANHLRAFSGGLLVEGSTFPGALPTILEATGMEEFDHVQGLFLSGDIRVNEMQGLAALHTIFFREHNRIAREIQASDPSLSDEVIFQDARRINIAVWQQIIYGEFLPTVLGSATAERFLLDTKPDSLYFDFVNPGAIHACATAAYRMGHTLINGEVEKYFKGARNSSFLLRFNFFNEQELIEDNGDGLERLVEGLFNQPGQSFDEHITEEVTEHLFQQDGHDFGEDLVARNLQRARDHAIGSYNQYREFCGMTALTESFADKPEEIPQNTWDQLEQVYGSPLEIELFSGGISEIPAPDAVVGPTFSCIIAYQFFNIKHGDRFFFTHVDKIDSPDSFKATDAEFYEQINNGNVEYFIRSALDELEDQDSNYAEGFTSGQRDIIRNRRLSDVICDNAASIDYVTEYAMIVQSGSNRVIPCSERQALDVAALLSQ